MSDDNSTSYSTSYTVTVKLTDEHFVSASTHTGKAVGQQLCVFTIEVNNSAKRCIGRSHLLRLHLCFNKARASRRDHYRESC